MDIESEWQKSLKMTRVVRSRVMPLATHENTLLPYVFLAESTLNRGDTVVRKGEITIEKPAIILPENLPSFEGFDFEQESPVRHDFITTFFMVRGIRFPSLRYQNKTESLDVFEGYVQKASDYWDDKLRAMEDVRTGLVCGPEESWQFSILILVAHQISRQADGDIRKLIDKYREEKDI